MKAGGLNRARFVVIPVFTFYPWTGLIAPMLLFSVVAQRHIVKGMTLGAVKG